MYRGAIIGNPIEHSLSPAVFDMFSKESGINLTYDKVLATDTTSFNRVVADFFNNGGTVLTVTSPFKQDAYNLANVATARSKFCRAANFLRLNGSGQVVADTTDGTGLLRDIEQNYKVKLANKNILIIGSGFVLDSILLDLIVANPLSIDVLARNKDRIGYLVDKFGINGFSPDKKYDIILNTVPNSSDNILLEQITKINSDAFCYEMAYSDFANNKFHKYIKVINSNTKVVSGIGMLVEQAEVVFKTLFNYSPKTIDVIKKLTI